MDKQMIQKKIRPIAEKYGLDFVVLFGSQATGTTHPKSDVDIAFFSQQMIELSEECKLSVELMELFRRNDIDLVNLTKSSPLLRKNIMSNCHLLYERQKGFVNEFYISTIRSYQQSKVLFGVRKNYINHKMQTL